MSKTTGPSCATPGAFIKVRIDNLELLEADDIDKKLKFLPKWPPFQIFQFWGAFRSSRLMLSIQTSSTSATN